jgi:hypothetical protein
MPKGKTHKVVGTVTGAAIAIGYSYYITQDPKNAWQYGIGGSLGGYALSRLADILEPSEVLGPNHRGAFHGIALNGGVAVLGFETIKDFLDWLVGKAIEFDKREDKFMTFLCRCAVGAIVGGVSGHTSHLIADSTTPQGLALFD